jgi:hypothetical protein
VSTGRRHTDPVPKLTRRAWEDVASELEGWLRRIFGSEADGIPSGYNEYLPTTIEAGDVGDPGLGNSVGWAAADHEHPVGVDIPSGLANANVEGTSTALVRADHQHKRDVRVQMDGADVGTRNALNFIGLTAVDDGVGDKVDVTAAGSDGEILAYYGL